jgi:MoxR-like ATPase
VRRDPGARVIRIGRTAGGTSVAVSALCIRPGLPADHATLTELSSASREMTASPQSCPRPRATTEVVMTEPARGPQPTLVALETADPRTTAEAVLFEVRRVIVGQDQMLERILVALLSGGHLLLEGVPGLAKTLTIRTLAEALDASFRRIQFTPDLVPGDLVGTRIYRPDSGTFDTELGPVFCNFLLADEINRAPAKVQSALLEVMQERQVTIGQESRPVPSPFLVMATQNPIESEGTYPLPEAQVDRFMMKVVVGYPTPAEEAAVVERSLRPAATVRAVLTAEGLKALQAATPDVYVDPAIVQYAVAIATATREPGRFGLPQLAPYIAYGASPRGSINLIHAARALALIRGRRYVLPGDVLDLAPDVLRHRIVPSFNALAEEVSVETLLDQLLPAIPMPRQVTEERTA